MITLLRAAHPRRCNSSFLHLLPLKPSALCKLPSLQNLSLFDNYLGGSMVSIPSPLPPFQNLYLLELSQKTDQEAEPHCRRPRSIDILHDKTEAGRFGQVWGFEHLAIHTAIFCSMPIPTPSCYTPSSSTISTQSFTPRSTSTFPDMVCWGSITATQSEYSSSPGSASLQGTRFLKSGLRWV